MAGGRDMKNGCEGYKGSLPYPVWKLSGQYRGVGLDQSLTSLRPIIEVEGERIRD